ncbi:MAG: adenosylcobinamide-GDP ribazoletransferase [Thermoleophilia bacterium]|nr:adenosylcobinamide-GDP ribazoletransferase [Thermoleophilia bacterium]
MRQLRLAFGFFTILPLARAGGIEEVTRAAFLLPLVAVFLGGVEGLAGWGLSGLFEAQVVAAIILALALLLTGLHHADGLADVGDAVMAGGSRSRRLAVLKDRTMGIGAIAALLLVYLVSWAALSEALPGIEERHWPWLMMSVELSARFSLFALAMFSRPSHKGSGSVFIAGSKGWRGMAASAIVLILLALLAIPLGILIPLVCGAGALAVAILLAAAGRRWFGGANGDLLGASVETGRVAALLAAAAAL